MVPNKKLTLAIIGLGVLAMLISSMILAPRLARAALESDSHQILEYSQQVFLPLISSPTQLIEFIQHEGELLGYQGAATCLKCHPTEVHDFAASNHYLWEGKFGSINDYCSYPDINFGPGKLTNVDGKQLDGGCAICHAGLGELPTSGNPENADCLMCHAEAYRRTAVQVGGVWRFKPNYDLMPTG